MQSVDQVFIFFPPTSDIGRSAVVDYSKRMHENNVNHGIIISENNLTPAAKQVSILFYFLFLLLNGFFFI